MAVPRSNRVILDRPRARSLHSSLHDTFPGSLSAVAGATLGRGGGPPEPLGPGPPAAPPAGADARGVTLGVRVAEPRLTPQPSGRSLLDAQGLRVLDVPG